MKDFIKAVLLFIAGFVAAGIAVRLLYSLIPKAVGFGLGFFIMFLFLYPAMRLTASRRISFGHWLLVTSLGALAQMILAYQLGY
jgi:uncharacterized membrane-anchored protein